jgi:hypothetical protein
MQKDTKDTPVNPAENPAIVRVRVPSASFKALSVQLLTRLFYFVDSKIDEIVVKKGYFYI